MQVIVGSAGTLSFEPTAVEAPVGTLLIFNFLALNHTLTQSSFSHPCASIDGFDTGFNNFNPRNITGKYITEYVVETTEPQWFFCAQEAVQSHCTAGMVFTLNGHNKTHEFIENAYSSNSTFNNTGSGPWHDNDENFTDERGNQTGRNDSKVEDGNSTAGEKDMDRTISSIVLTDSGIRPSQNDSGLFSENVGVRYSLVSVSGVITLIAIIHMY